METKTYELTQDQVELIQLALDFYIEYQTDLLIENDEFKDWVDPEEKEQY